MNDFEKMINDRVSKLELEMSQFSRASTIPVVIDNALAARGFLKRGNTFLSGQATLNVSAQALVGVPGISVNCIPFAACDDLSGDPVGAIISNSSGQVILTLDGPGAGRIVNWIVFIPTDKTQS